jgi:hypothetical protein
MICLTYVNTDDIFECSASLRAKNASPTRHLAPRGVSKNPGSFMWILIVGGDGDGYFGLSVWVTCL